jgi:hypothetical protein
VAEGRRSGACGRAAGDRGPGNCHGHGVGGRGWWLRWLRERQARRGGEFRGVWSWWRRRRRWEEGQAYAQVRDTEVWRRARRPRTSSVPLGGGGAALGEAHARAGGGGEPRGDDGGAWGRQWGGSRRPLIRARPGTVQPRCALRERHGCVCVPGHGAGSGVAPKAADQGYSGAQQQAIVDVGIAVDLSGRRRGRGGCTNCKLCGGSVAPAAVARSASGSLLAAGY